MDATTIWKRYEKGVDHHHRNNFYTDTEKYYNMVEANQWAGLESGKELFSSHDFISSIVNHKTAMVAMNQISINYSCTNTGEDRALYKAACDLLNEFAKEKWETTKMDVKDWDVVNQACIAGDSYLYFYNSKLESQIIDRTNIYLSDEQEPDMQKQRRVIIYERRPVQDVRDEAKENKVKDIDMILSDDDTQTLPEAGKAEVDGEEKCSCLLQIEKKKDGIYICRSTKTVVYQPETKINDLTLVPIGKMIWSGKRYSARGIGEVERLYNNQINTNKLLAIRYQNNKMTGYPRPVYNADSVANPEDMMKVASPIKIKGMPVNKIRDIFDYVAPQAMSGDGKILQDELINTSRDLANAGDNATGNVNPERASGAAIIAVKDQQAIATTKQAAFHKQFIEDVASIWLDILKAYNPNGLKVPIEQEGEIITIDIPAEILTNLQTNIRIDVSPVNPFSKFAREQSLENALAQKHISFEEYVEALDDDGTAPKGKFEEILSKRQEMAPPPNMPPEGGDIDVMSQMQANGINPGQGY